jgi:hypothetical protein
MSHSCGNGNPLFFENCIGLRNEEGEEKRAADEHR